MFRFSKPLRYRTWAATGRDPDDVLDAALAEFDQGSLGASAFELAAVASHHLSLCTVRSGRRSRVVTPTFVGATPSAAKITLRL